MNDKRVLEIPCRRDGPLPLVDVGESSSVFVDTRKRDSSGEWRLLRAPVRQRLIQAAELLPDGFAFLFIEGYRPTSLQQHYFEAYSTAVRSADSTLTGPEVDSLASRHVSPPQVAPHCAGAAIDLTLATSSGHELDLGTRVNATPEESGNHCYTEHPGVQGEAEELRRLLAHVMQGAGFVNYPTEWWHWSYGDRYWAMATGHDEALFDSVDGVAA